MSGESKLCLDQSRYYGGAEGYRSKVILFEIMEKLTESRTNEAPLPIRSFILGHSVLVGWSVS